MNSYKLHAKKVNQIAKRLQEYKKSGNKNKIRFDHKSTNSTRVQDKSGNFIIDISSLDQILQIDNKKKVATLEPNVSMERLVDECLKRNLVPKVVMEFPAITCGGAVNGAALEASSFKYGQFNDTCLEYEFLLGDGSLIKASKENNKDLFYGVSGSYGSMALLTLITVSLVPASPFVRLTLAPIDTNSLVSELKILTKQRKYDYIEAIIFSKENSVLLLGRLEKSNNVQTKTFSKASDEWFYLYAKKVADSGCEKEIQVPLKDYLFRYNRGAFWMGKYAFSLSDIKVPFNRLTRYLLNFFLSTKIMYKALHKSGMGQKFFIQDFYIPLSKTEEFINICSKKLKIFPLWLCPIAATKNSQFLSPHYLSESMLIDVGIWGLIPASQGRIAINRFFEESTHKTGGRKMLYAENFYTEREFWKIYDRRQYTKLRQKYHSEVFANIWEKISVKKSYKINKWKGIFQAFFETVLRSS